MHDLLGLISFFGRRFLVRLANVLFYIEVIDFIAVEGLKRTVWSDDHFGAFLLGVLAVSLLIDLFIEVTLPESKDKDETCDSNDSSLD